MKYLKYALLLIVIIVAFVIGKGLMTPEISYQNEVTVSKSAKESWAVMSDESNLPKWLKGYVKSELISGTAGTVGAVSKIYVQDDEQEMVMEETITALTENQHMAMNFTMDFMDMDYDVTFTEKEGQTTIATQSTVKGNGIFSKSMVAFMGDAMITQEQENLDNLKQLIEENTTDYFPTPVVDSLQVIIE